MKVGIVIIALVVTGGLVAPAGAVAREVEQRPETVEAAQELQAVLQAEYPDGFAGLWLEGDEVHVAVVGNDPAVADAARARFPDPERLHVTTAEYSEAELYAAMEELNEVFDRLHSEQSVVSLAIRVQENRVVVGSQQPDAVDVTEYVSEDVADMVIVEDDESAQTLEDTAPAQDTRPAPEAGRAGRDTPGVLFGVVAALVLGLAALWFVRRSRSST